MEKNEWKDNFLAEYYALNMEESKEIEAALSENNEIGRYGTCPFCGSPAINGAINDPMDRYRECTDCGEYWEEG